MYAQMNRRRRARRSGSMGWLGQSPSSAELDRIRAERAQVEAEIKRLEAGGAPAAGGFRPTPPAASVAPVAGTTAALPALSIPQLQLSKFGIPSWVVPVAGVVGLIGLGWILLGKRSG